MADESARRVSRSEVAGGSGGRGGRAGAAAASAAARHGDEDGGDPAEPLPGRGPGDGGTGDGAGPRVSREEAEAPGSARRASGPQPAALGGGRLAQLLGRVSAAAAARAGGGGGGGGPAGAPFDATGEGAASLVQEAADAGMLDAGDIARLSERPPAGRRGTVGHWRQPRPRGRRGRGSAGPAAPCGCRRRCHWAAAEAAAAAAAAAATPQGCTSLD
jgi:hypothetical protein